MARRMDRRVQRTRKLLREALMELILEEGYDAISIQDITDKANLGRATFYLHFKDKDELLLDVMDQFMEDFLDQVPQFSQSQWQMEDTKAIAKLFDFAADHYDLYRILIIGSGGITASRKLHQTIAENIKTCIQKEIDEQDANPAVPTDFIANHFAGALLATIYWWLDSDLPYSVDEIAEMFQKINRMDRDSLMGLPGKKENDAQEEDRRKKRGKDRKTNQKDKKDSEDPAEPSAEEPAESDVLKA
jgi:AcrR family transcriptional regulator